jgi:hypothetical protein
MIEGANFNTGAVSTVPVVGRVARMRLVRGKDKRGMGDE